MKDLEITYRIVKPIIQAAIIQHEIDTPTEMQKNVIDGEFVRLRDLKEYEFSIPDEIWQELTEKLGSELHIQMYTQEIRRLEYEILQLRHDLWDAKVPLFVKILSFGTYAFFNPYNPDLNLN